MATISDSQTIRFRTPGFSGYAVEFSPFMEDRVACASASNYGIAGNGRVWILRIGDPYQNGAIHVERTYDTQDGVFDCAWSESHENQIVTSSGDGSVKLWDIALPDFPVRSWMEHQREVFTVNWNLVSKDVFVTGSWDHTIKLWSPERDASIMTWMEHIGCVYSTVWNPSQANVFASAGDTTVRVWDTRQPRSIHGITVGNADVLAVEWDKYRGDTVYTGSVDTTLRVWDLRYTKSDIGISPDNVIGTHEFAVRRVKTSPHVPNVVATASYDMTMRVWDAARPKGDWLVRVHGDHTEFVCGVDWSMFRKGLCVTCGWDEEIHLFYA